MSQIKNLHMVSNQRKQMQNKASKNINTVSLKEVLTSKSNQKYRYKDIFTYWRQHWIGTGI